MITFGYGILIFICSGLFIWAASIFLSKKISGNGALGGVFGFFLAAATFFVPFFMAGRLYVVTGDGEYTDYFVFKYTNYKLANEAAIEVDIYGQQCMVINDWDTSVVVEFVKYGGFGFGGDTKFVKPQEGKYFPENKIFYFYEDEPPQEISIKTSEDQVTRLWLRNKR